MKTILKTIGIIFLHILTITLCAKLKYSIFQEILGIFTLIITIILDIILITKYKKVKKNKGNKIRENKENNIYTKKRLVTKCEEQYGNIIQKILNRYTNNYTLKSQVNLASIIEKNSYRANELFRNIDFGVFNNNYEVIVLIEINDKSHFKKNRIERDIKVNNILNQAGIPIITLWTKDGINEQYIKKRLDTFCY